MLRILLLDPKSSYCSSTELLQHSFAVSLACRTESHTQREPLQGVLMARFLREESTLSEKRDLKGTSPKTLYLVVIVCFKLKSSFKYPKQIKQV